MLREQTECACAITTDDIAMEKQRGAQAQRQVGMFSEGFERFRREAHVLKQELCQKRGRELHVHNSRVRAREERSAIEAGWIDRTEDSPALQPPPLLSPQEVQEEARLLTLQRTAADLRRRLAVGEMQVARLDALVGDSLRSQHLASLQAAMRDDFLCPDEGNTEALRVQAQGLLRRLLSFTTGD